MSTLSIHPTFRRATLADRRAISHHFTPVAPAEAQPAFDLIQPLPVYVEQHHLCDLNWKWRELTPAYLAERIAAKAVYQWDEVECCFEARA
jgi:hypothetical protein